MNYNKSVSDGILIGLSSITGDLVGEYALPYLSHMAINSPILEHVLQKGLSPILTGLGYIVYTKTMQNSNEFGTDTLLGVASKLGGNYVSGMLPLGFNAASTQNGFKLA